MNSETILRCACCGAKNRVLLSLTKNDKKWDDEDIDMAAKRLQALGEHQAAKKLLANKEMLVKNLLASREIL